MTSGVNGNQTDIMWTFVSSKINLISKNLKYNTIQTTYSTHRHEEHKHYQGSTKVDPPENLSISQFGSFDFEPKFVTYNQE